MADYRRTKLYELIYSTADNTFVDLHPPPRKTVLPAGKASVEGNTAEEVIAQCVQLQLKIKESQLPDLLQYYAPEDQADAEALIRSTGLVVEG